MKIPIQWIVMISILLSSLAASLSAGQTFSKEGRPVVKQAGSPQDDWRWPEVTRESRPWTRWWWLGSAVDRENLSRLLLEYKKAGLGGVEICPIYGAKGYEDRFIPFLSPRWMEMLQHTVSEAERRGLGVDLTTGTGWPFGGPSVSNQDASALVLLERYTFTGGEVQTLDLPEGELQCLMAVSSQGEEKELSSLVVGHHLRWDFPPGTWTLYAVLKKGPVQQVKRAAPGGEGNVLDPYSTSALDRYLAVFDRAFAGYSGKMPRSHFHDSFEYYGAQWTGSLLQEFQRRRGYDLRHHLPALFGEGSSNEIARVKCDYRETISDLHLEYMRHWTEWCHRKGSLSRNQAHGAPANLVDLYAASDIPETEIFGSLDEKQMPLNKFSSSAAHLGGRRLASSESFTWLTEHFQANLPRVKQAADYLFLAGVNHIFFHGIPYSPAEAPWPGWQFYASVNFGPQGGLWRDLPEFNSYIARCQSILQSGTPANDLLLYFPAHDIWQSTEYLLLPFDLHNLQRWLYPHSFYAAASRLWKEGYSFDYLSDRFLAEARVQNGRIVLGGNSYEAILLPQCRVLPHSSLGKLMDLAKAGARILVEGNLPADVPGLENLEQRRKELGKISKEIQGLIGNSSGGSADRSKRGGFHAGPDLGVLLQEAGISRESSADLGLRLIRRRHAEGYHYFLVNRGEYVVDGWIPLDTIARSVIILDPRFPDRKGLAALRNGKNGNDEVYLQLEPGESCILRTFDNKSLKGPAWSYFRNVSEGSSLSGAWTIQFLEGGPALPGAITTEKLESWTLLGDEEARRFAGTARYTLLFDRPAGKADEWLLDLGRICESARIKLNGQEVTALWAAPFRIEVGQWLRPGKNSLEVEVTNLAANRVADLDRQHVSWKYFYDANLVGKDYRPLDASAWALFDSGLLGPVKLIPLRKISFRP